MIADDTDAIARRLAELRSERAGRAVPTWRPSTEEERVLEEMFRSEVDRLVQKALPL